MAQTYRVYWQPGCSSCLRAKEFLKSHGIPFESVNIREGAQGLEELAELGLRTVPVVLHGNRYVLGQDLKELADFVGIEHTRTELTPAELVEKLDGVMAAAQRYARQLPAQLADGSFPGRSRTHLDLAFHVFMIPYGFLEAARGGKLEFEHFERKPGHDVTHGEHVATFGQSVREDLAIWWQSTTSNGLPNTVRTYYGDKEPHDVLERTAWHAAHHARQLMTVIERHGIEPDGPLTDKELSGLPLPSEIYDDEVKL